MEPVTGQLQREHSARAARTYTAAADHYLRPALGFWDRWGGATVARVPLSSGDAVLDVCCGAGASALPAARAVGPAGEVLGLDLAQPLLALARQRAANLGLTNVSFRECDATASGLRSGSFDAVVCVFGVFFAADMPAFVAEMWRLVRPGGTLAITTWGPDWAEPASSLFWCSVRELEPTLFRAFNPWDEITTGPAMADLLARGGIGGAAVEATTDEHHELERAEDFWDIVLGSGYRGTVDALGDEQRQRLRERVVGELRSRGVTRLRNDVVFGSAVKRTFRRARTSETDVQPPARAVQGTAISEQTNRHRDTGHDMCLIGKAGGAGNRAINLLVANVWALGVADARAAGGIGQRAPALPRLRESPVCLLPA